MGFYDQDDEYDDDDPYERLVDEVGERIISRDQQFRVEFFDHFVRAANRDFGGQGLIDLLFAIDRNMSWETEILADRPEIENILMERHGSFDGEIWDKVQETQSWVKMHEHIYRLSRRYLEAAVDEVVRQEL